MSRLPTPGQDGGSWGNILNDFLRVEHNDDGSLKSGGSLASKANDSAVVHNSGNETVAGTKTFASSPIVPTPTDTTHAATKAYVDSTASSGAPDATPSTNGLVRLAGDLGGTGTAAAAPIISDNAITGSKLAANAVTDAKVSTSANIAKSKLAALNIGDSDVSAISQSKITGLSTSLAGKVDTTRAINTGTGLSGGGDLSADRTLTVTDDSTTQRVRVSKAGTVAGTRQQINFVEGSNVTITSADDNANNRVNVTIASATQATTLVVNVKDQGAIGDGSADDTTAINNAFTAAQASSKKATVYFPPGTYKTTSVLTIYEGMTLSGPIGAGEREFANRAVISNTTTDIFQLSADTKDISISNLCFQGNSSNYFLTPVNQASGFILKYSTISNCGFKFFNSVFSARWLGVWFNQNYLNNCAGTLLNVAGSDCTIRDNFMDSNLAGTPTAAFIVLFTSMSDTLFEGNYITCCPSMGMRITGGGSNVIAFNKFNGLSPRGSGSDGAGLYITGTNAIDVIGNYFGYNVQNPFSQYTGAVTVYDSSGITLTDNTFEQLPATRNAYTIGQSSGTTDSIRIKGSIYRSSTSKLSTAGTVTNLTWDEWQGKYKTGSGARIADSDYPGTPPDGTTGIVYDTSNSTTYIAQRANGAWTHLSSASIATGLPGTSNTSTVTVSNTTTETALASYTIAGGSALAGDTYLVALGGNADTGTGGGTITINLRIGGAAGLQLTGLQWTLDTTARTNRAFNMEFEVTIRGNASSSTAMVTMARGFNNMVTSGQNSINYAAASSNLTTTKDLTLSAVFSVADASHAFRAEVASIVKIR